MPSCPSTLLKPLLFSYYNYLITIDTFKYLTFSYLVI